MNVIVFRANGEKPGKRRRGEKWKGRGKRRIRGTECSFEQDFQGETVQLSLLR